MRTRVNKEELKREWILNHWYEKVFYVVGIVWSVFLVLGFMAGVLEGISEW